MRRISKALALGALSGVLALPAGGQGVPTIDATSLAKLAEQLPEAKLQLKEWLGSVAVHDVFLSPISFLHLLTMHTKAK